MRYEYTATFAASAPPSMLVSSRLHPFACKGFILESLPRFRACGGRGGEGEGDGARAG